MTRTFERPTEMLIIGSVFKNRFPAKRLKLTEYEVYRNISSRYAYVS